MKGRRNSAHECSKEPASSRIRFPLSLAKDSQNKREVQTQKQQVRVHIEEGGKRRQKAPLSLLLLFFCSYTHIHTWCSVMSQLPSIHLMAGRGRGPDDRGATTGPDGSTSRETPVNRRSGSPLDTLKSLSTNSSFSSDTRRKLVAVLRSAERERERGAGASSNGGGELLRTPDRSGSPASQASLASSCRHHLTPIVPDVDSPRSRSWFHSLNDGCAPQARVLCEELTNDGVRARNFDVAELPFRGRLAAGTASCAPDSSRRATPALQNPHEAFETMNKALTYTMRYVEEVTELDFDITSVKEYDGSEMEDKERLFLSVCCSSITNFAFCATLNVDLRKLAHFLADLYKYYSAVNPFHNAIHAADSVQMVSLFFRDPAVNFLFTDEEILLCFLAVLALDVAHPGVRISTLAEMNHPLVVVYGDMTAKEQSSLLVFTHQLFLDDNYFLNLDSPNHFVVRSRSALREMLYDIVLPSAPRMRPFLASELARVGAQHMVRLVDINRLLGAILFLCSNGFAMRSSFMALTWASWWQDELEREEEERQRQLLQRFPSANSRAGGQAQWVVDYCDIVVRAVAEAVRALIPTDLYDNLERNCDLATFRSSIAAFAGLGHSGGSGKDSQTPAPFASSAAEDIRNGVQVSAWTDTTSDIMEILKRTAAHANSLDRKASRGAILNASPPRAGVTVSKEWRVSGANNGSGRRSSNSVVFGVSVTSAGTAEDDDVHVGEGVQQLYPNRSEHYFSFLRLYDVFEREGRASDDFAGQLVFLALQLDSGYIATSAREKFGDGCNAATCVAMAAYIRETEEAPATAEAIATARVPPSSFFAAEETKGTDSFILYLMEMYERRETAAAAMGEDCESVVSTGPSLPADANAPHRSSPANTAVPVVRDSSPPSVLPQRDSPIRMPVGTDTSAVRTTFPAHPLVGGSTGDRSSKAYPPFEDRDKRAR